MNPQKVIIIGSGVAGLAAAIRLAAKGMQVSVYEKNSYPGGKISGFEKEGYRFDAGPSLFTQPENIEELFALANEPIEEYFQYQPVDTSCRYFYENGKVINAYTDKDRFATELVDVAGERESSLSAYLQRAQKLYNSIGTVFLDNSLHKRRTWFHPRIIKAFGAVRFPYLFNTLASYNNRQFTSPEAKQIFNRFATYNGSDPFKAPAMLSLIPHLENQGTFYPKGGMISITQALYKLAVKMGARFYFDKPVDRIIHTEARVHGVVVNGDNIHADFVVSNADVYFTFSDLLGHQVKAKKILKKERSSSALIFYWGISKSNPSLGLHNIFFSKNYKHEFKSLFDKKSLSSDPTIYVNITSRMDESHAPLNKENWFVMVNVPANTGQDWKRIQAQTKKYIVDKLNRMMGTDIEPLIETEEIMDPQDLEDRTGSFRGSLYGTSSNSKMAAFSRPPNFTSYAKGLYFCGGSVHPGGGIPLCIKSAKIVADLIGRDIKKS